ncbi:MAG TPA: MFS transporter [Caulobacteraceae bacterium]|nr:MFS transporter [Caulobacteraceae bacterium]
MTAASPAPKRAPLYRNLDYVFLVAAQGVSITGREIEGIVLPLLVLALTGSPAQVGLVAAAQGLPYLILGLPAGALVDRWDARRVMMACDAVRTLAFASLPAAWALGVLSMAQLYGVALITGAAFVFYNIAEISGITRLVGQEDLPRALSVNGVVEWVGANGGPVLGGVLTGLGRTTIIGAMMAYAVQAAMLGVSVVLLGGIRTPIRAERSAPKHLAAEIRDGLGWLLRHRLVRGMAGRAMALNIFFSPVVLAMIVLARQSFHAAPAAIGVMFSAAGLGGLAATIAAPWLRPRIPVGWIMTGAVVIWGFAMMAMAAAPNLIVLGLTWAVMPAISGIADVTTVSYRLSLIPAEMQGRVNSVFRLLAWGLNPVSLAVGGVLVASLGARPTLWILAAGVAATAVVTLFGPLRSAR